MLDSFLLELDYGHICFNNYKFPILYFFKACLVILQNIISSLSLMDKTFVRKEDFEDIMYVSYLKHGLYFNKETHFTIFTSLKLLIYNCEDLNDCI